MRIMRQSFWGFAVVSAMMTVSGSASAQVGELILQHGLVPSEGTSAIDEMVIEGGPGSAGSGFQIVINPNSTLSGNTAALAAFERAARQWEQFISDPITVVINAGLQSLGSGILGSTFTPVVGAGMFDIVRDAMVLDAMDEGADDAIVASLPTASQFSFLTNGGTNPQVVNDIGMTRANAKVLGFTLGAGADATINFSTNFAFDFDNSDGVGAACSTSSLLLPTRSGTPSGSSRLSTTSTARSRRAIYPRSWRSGPWICSGSWTTQPSIRRPPLHSPRRPACLAWVVR